MPKTKNPSSPKLRRAGKNRKLVIQAVEYLISGGAYFWVGYGVFALLWSVLGWSLWWAKLVANLAGWTVNFLMQRYWVFKNPRLKGHLGQVTGRYILITLVDFMMDYFIIVWLRGIGISPYIGNFISAGFFTIWNYIWYRWWVFPQRLPSPRHPARRHVRPHHMASK